MSGGGARFPKQARLRKRPEFLSLSEGGRKVHTSHFVVISKANDREESRLGITVSARVGNAVVRNRVKRLLREFFRRYRHEIVPNQDILVIAKREAESLSFQDVTHEIRQGLRSSREKRTRQ